MSRFVLTKTAPPATPAANKSAVYVDTTTRRLSQIDDTGVISGLVQSGQRDMPVSTNGGFVVQQRVAVALTAIPAVSATTRAGQVADRWAITVGNVATPQWQQVDTSGAPETGLTSRYYGRLTQITNAAKFILSQFIINSEMAHLRGTQVRVSCKIKQIVGSNANYRIGLLQLNASGTVDVCPTFISAIGANGVEPTWGTNLAAITPDASPVGENGTISGVALTVASTANWVKSSCVFTVPSTAKNLVIVIYRDTIGAAADSVGIAEVQLTQGPEIVDWVPLPLNVELLRCQRFYCKSFPLTTVPAAALTEAAAGTGAAGIIGKAGATALAAVINVQFPTTMWKVPVVTLFTPVGAGAVPFRITGTTPAVQTAVAQRGLTDRGLTVTATGDANGAVGDLVGVHYVAEAEFIT